MESRSEQVEAWYKEKAKHVRKWASKYSKEDGEDILQEIALNLLTNPGEWVNISRSKVEKWTMYEFYNPERGFKGTKDVKLVKLETAATQASPGNIETDLYNKKCVELVTELVDSIGGAGKQIFQMHFFQDMGYDEIALKLGMPHGSVRQLGSRSKGIIKEKFNQIIGE